MRNETHTLRREETIHKVVSVCSSRDLRVWRQTASGVSTWIPARVREVVVPDSEVDLFEHASPEGYVVVPESEYLNGRDLRWFQSRLPESLRGRAGWFLQQVVKVEAVVRAQDDDIVLLWDADTVPLRKLSFFEGGKLAYRIGREHHHEYFHMISGLLGLERRVHFSFIAQCFPARASWIKRMCRDIEAIHGTSWVEAMTQILHQVPGSLLSEYETMGTYVQASFPDDIAISRRRWFRYGNRLLGSPERLSGYALELLAHKYDYVSFEHWDTGKPNLLSYARNLLKWVDLFGARFLTR